MATQYGFYYNPARCVQCHTCELACKSTHDIEPWVQWRHVVETWDGKYPDITRTFFSKACMHCEKPACMSACPTGAITKRDEDGIVIVDAEKCNGCRDCLSACPFDIPQFGEDGIMQKCDYCLDIGGKPVCAESCPTGALKCGILDELMETTGKTTLKKMGGNTRPSIIIMS